jgi:hypothetical protein
VTLIRLYRIHRSGGRSRRLAMRLAWQSIRRDVVLERERAAARRRAQSPFVTSRAGDL